MIAALHIDDLAVQRGERILFKGFSLTVAAGEAVALVGANGAGKTSLLRCVAGLLRPIAGNIRFRDGETETDPEEARRFSCHMVGHQDGLKGARTANSPFRPAGPAGMHRRPWLRPSGWV